jgi:hypothetical protein
VKTSLPCTRVLCYRAPLLAAACCCCFDWHGGGCVVGCASVVDAGALRAGDCGGAFALVLLMLVLLLMMALLMMMLLLLALLMLPLLLALLLLLLMLMSASAADNAAGAGHCCWCWHCVYLGVRLRQFTARCGNLPSASFGLPVLYKRWSWLPSRRYASALLAAGL